MKHFFLSLLLIANLPALAQLTVNIKWLGHIPSASSDTVYYSNGKKLSWPDFKAAFVYSTEAVALTSSGFGYRADIQYEDGKTDVTVEVFCYFSKKGSWVIPGRESDYALNHEQHHFDVAYIAANSFIKKLNAANFTEANYTAVMREIYTKSCSEFANMQNDYDGQTKNGQLKNIQEEWDILVALQLHLLRTLK